MVLSSSSIVEGGTETVSGTIESLDGFDTDTVSLNWGDGSVPTTIVLPATTPSRQPIPTCGARRGSVENDTIGRSVANQNGQVSYASASVTVNKVGPQFTAADLCLSKKVANEGDTITLRGQFADRTRRARIP